MAPIEESMSTTGVSAGGSSPIKKPGSKKTFPAGSPAGKSGSQSSFGRGAPSARFGKSRSLMGVERVEKSKELLDAITARSAIHGKPDKLWATIGAKMVVKHSFGSSAEIADPVISFAGPPSANSDLDYSDRIISSVGAQIVFTNVEDGTKYFVSGRPDNVVGILHIAIDHTMQIVSVCENTCGPAEEEGDKELKSQLSIYSVLGKERECLATLSHPNSSQFTASLFTRGTGTSAKQVVAMCGAPQPEIVVWNWDTKKTIKVVSMPAVANKIRCAPTPQFMLTTSGENGLRSWYNQGETLSNLNLIPPNRDTDPCIAEHVWMPSGNGLNKLAALSTVLAPGEGKRNNFRRQLLYILEGRDSTDKQTMEKTSAKSASGCPIGLEVRQTVILKLSKDHEDAKFTALCSSMKGFVMVGNYGHVSIYERTDDKREPYIEVRHLLLGEEFPLVGVCMLPSEHQVVVMTEMGRLLSMPVEMNIESVSVGRQGKHGDDDTSVASVSEAERLIGYGASDVTHGGVHKGAITCSDMAVERSILVTLCVDDNTARIWNYETQKCEVVHHFGSDEPLSIAVHTNGLFMVVSFKDRVRGYNIGMAALKPYKEVIQKGCKEILFSHSGQYFACASGINLVVFNSTTFKQVMNFQGHMMPIKKIAWAPGDLVLFSASVDGTVYGWPTSRDGRIDVVASNPRASAILSLEIDSSNMAFLPPLPENAEDGGVPAQREEEDRFLLLSTNNGKITSPAWAYSSATWDHVKNHNHSIHDEEASAITCLKLSANRRHLYAGTKLGTVRIYAWPPSVNDNKVGLYTELQAHNGPVVSINESPRGDKLVSSGNDGAVFCFSLTKAPWTNIPASELKSGAATDEAPPASTAVTALLGDLDDMLEDPFEYNNKILLLGADEMEEHVEEVASLHKHLRELENNSAYKLSQMETSARESQRRMAEEFDATLNEERDRYEQLRTEFDEKVKSLLTTIESKEADSLKVVSDLENRYEHKLSDQLDRYDKLAEEMELLRQKCEGLLLADRNDFTKQLNDTINNARLREKKMRAENKRITDDRGSDEAAFKEILDQQEHEYEDELRQLIAAAEGELIVERENIGKLRTLVQTKNTKLDQLKKKLIELSMASKARATLLNNEKNEKIKLLETIEHYKKNLVEREEVVAEKEKIIMELRSKTRTLENFRFVLDHRLQQLSAERGPISSHIEGLERHISTMYEELVEEFENKKENEIIKEKSEQRANLVVEDLNRVHILLRKSDRYINAFKRELGNIVSAMVMGKELEESVRLLYRKYVKGEVIGETTVKASEQATAMAMSMIHKKDDDLAALNSTGQGGGGAKGFILEVEETLIESAKEAERQKISKGKEALQLKRRLTATKQEALVVSRQRLGENSNLLFEVNDLRKDVRQGQRKLAERDETIKELEHAIRGMKKRGFGTSTASAATGNRAAVSEQISSREQTPNITETFNAPLIEGRMPKGVHDDFATKGDSGAERPSTPGTGGDRTPAEINDTENDVAALIQAQVNMKINIGKGGEVSQRLQPVLQASKSESALRRVAGVGIDARPTSGPKWIVHNALHKAKSDAELIAEKMTDTGEAVQLAGQAWQPRADHNSSPTLAPAGERVAQPVDDHLQKAINKKTKAHKDVPARDLNGVIQERDILAQQLDEAWRLRDNQRIEIAQLRKQLMRASGTGFGAAAQSWNGNHGPAVNSHSHVGTQPVQSFVDDYDIQMSGDFQGSFTQADGSVVWGDPQGGSLVLNNEPLRATPGLTSADRTGVPSASDLQDMRLGSVPTDGTQQTAYPNKSTKRVAQMAASNNTLKVKAKPIPAPKTVKAEASGSTTKSGNTISLPKINNNSIEGTSQAETNDDNEEDD